MQPIMKNIKLPIQQRSPLNIRVSRPFFFSEDFGERSELLSFQKLHLLHQQATGQQHGNAEEASERTTTDVVYLVAGGKQKERLTSCF